MKKTRSKVILFLTLLLTLGLLVSGCAKSNDYSTNESIRDYEKAVSDKEYGDYSPGSVDTDKAEESSPSSGSSGLDLVTDDGISDSLDMEKVIRKVNLEVETMEFDDLVNNIEFEISNLGGYVEHSDISGRSYDYGHRNRHGRIVARIPKVRLDDFVDIVGYNSNVVNQSQSAENVTLDYVDTESRKKALEIEQERIFELLEKADSIDMIITLEGRLTSIRYELQNLETKLRTIDNKVDYSTVTININEVQRMTPEIVEKPTVISRIKTGFTESIYDLTEGFKDFFVWFVVNLPYIIIWLIVIAIVTFIARRGYVKRKKRKEIGLARDDREDDGLNDDTQNK